MAQHAVDFEEWYRGAHPRLGTSLALAFGDVNLAQDALDEACSRALERWDRVAAMQSPTACVYTVAFNDARRRLRRAGLERRILRSRRTESVQPPAGEMWAVVADLPERQREAVVLRHVGQLLEDEIAATMGITRGTVSSTLRAAYKSLRIAIAEPVDVGESR